MLYLLFIKLMYTVQYLKINRFILNKLFYIYIKYKINLIFCVFILGLKKNYGDEPI